MSSAIIGKAILGQMVLNNSNDTPQISEHGNRMIDYYPDVVKAILEVKAIVNSEGYEFDELYGGVEHVISDAYLSTMLEDRIVVWENVLGIKPLEDSTLDDRRETIIARIRGQGKLNTKLINSIVNAFTGGTAKSWVKDSVLYVAVTPPPNNKSFRFENVEQELCKKVPAHLGFKISRNYYTWGHIRDSFDTWRDVNDDSKTWNDVYLFVPFD